MKINVVFNNDLIYFGKSPVGQKALSRSNSALFPVVCRFGQKERASREFLPPGIGRPEFSLDLMPAGCPPR
jgi:hypothetical protein